MLNSRSRSGSPRRERDERPSRHQRDLGGPDEGAGTGERRTKRLACEDAVSSREKRGREEDRGHRHHRHHRHHHHRSQHHRHGGEPARHPPVLIEELPFSARPLSKADLPAFQGLFAHYLSLQKQKDWEDMDDREVKGRWKSFVGKWNRGELAEGWYDPEMFERINAAMPERVLVREEEQEGEGEEAVSGEEGAREKILSANADYNNSDEEAYVPPLPPPPDSSRHVGAANPTRDDLKYRDELMAESEAADRAASLSALRQARRADRAAQRERLDELVPRADPGTRERKLEKQQALNEKMRAFREKSPGMDGRDDRELMGAADELEELKRQREREQRRKSRRQVWREEIERAKTEEMEVKKRAWARREEGTVNMLKELAKQRFG